MEIDQQPIAFIDACAAHAPACNGSRRSHYLTSIANRPLISHVIESIARAGAARVVIRTDPSTREALADLLEAQPAVSFVDADDQHVLEQLLTLAGVRPILASSGDCLFGDELIALQEPVHRGEQDAVTLGARHERRCNDSIARLGQTRLLPLGWDPCAVIASAAAWRQLGSQQRSFSLRGLAKAFESAGLRVKHLRSHHAWRYSDAPEQLLLANLMLLDAMPGNAGRSELPDGCLAQGRVRIDPSARISGTHLRGPALIGPNARIEDSFIGPYTTVGPNATVIGAEIEYAMVMEDAEVRYPGQRLEESVIGEGAVVSRIFALPSGMHLRVDAGAKVILS